MIATVLLLASIALTLLYCFFKTYYYEYWKRLGVSGPAPILFFGNILDNVFLRRSFADVINEIYNKYENEPFVGIYKMFAPVLILRDPEIIKKVTVESFMNFHENEMDIDVNIDPLAGRNPFVLSGAKWKRVRSELTPCFTSGKMKSAIPILDSNGEDFVDFIAKQPDAFNKTGLEAKELCTKLALNNVANYAFGLEGKCFEDEDCYFRKLAERFLRPSSLISFKLFVGLIIPSLAKFLKIKLLAKDLENDLVSLVKKTITYREKHHIIRSDFLHYMMLLKNTPREIPVEDIDIVGHCVTFFGDGYETSSVTLSLILYNLAANPEAQHRLREEIKEYLGEPGTKITYEKLQKMSYLDAVFNESLRVTPPVFILSKRCTKSYTWTPKDNVALLKKSVTIEPRTPIVLPLAALGHDPKYFEDPFSFNPERFLGENKQNIPKYTFMPFGEGPRACLGKRFGVLQVKMGMVHIIRNYEISVNSKTKTPLEYDKTYILASPIGGIWLDFKKIDK